MLKEQEQKPFWDKKKILALLILLVMAVAVVIRYDQKYNKSNPISKDDNPTFVISSWDYPDEYGQGIYEIVLKQNISGSFQFVEGSPVYPTDTRPYVIEPDGNLFLQVYVYFNRSHAGIDNVLAQGLNVIRLNVTVYNEDILVFSQQNFTKDASSQAGDPIWWLRYYVYLNFSPIAFSIYTTTITYEVFY